MELDLREVLQTLAVGAFMMASLEVVLHFVSGKTLHKRLALDSHLHPWGMNTLVLGLVVVAGLVCESASKPFVAKFRDSSSAPMRFAKNCFLPSEDDLRMAKLFVADGNFFRVTWLAEELQLHGAFKQLNKRDGDVVDKAIADAITARDQQSQLLKSVAGSSLYVLQQRGDVLQKAALGVYYAGHNRLYTGNMAMPELEGMERRINFGRSFAFASLCMVVVVLVVGMSCCRLDRQAWARTWKPILVLLLFFAFTYWVGRTVFLEEHEAYTIRIFGYESTILKNQSKAP